MQLADGTVLSQNTSNGFGETLVQAQPNTQGGFICTRSEYDALGNVIRETLALAEEPTVENSPVTEYAYGAEIAEEGIFSFTTATRYNAAGQPLTSTQKQLISQFSPTLESKVVSVSELGLLYLTRGGFHRNY